MQEEAASFRDRSSRVIYRDSEVFRLLDAQALSAWKDFSSTKFASKAMARGDIIQTTEASAMLASTNGSWAGALQHERLPFVSYPYEWCFGMLKDAALLHLELLLEALEEGLMIKDSSAFNIQFKDCRPVFIDIPSFEKWKPGEPWIAYRQFCEMFLFPLMLGAYKGIEFQPLLRSELDGISADYCRKLFSARDFLRGGAFSHVYLQAKLQKAFANSNRSVKRELSASGFHTELIKINVRKIRKLISKMDFAAADSTWSEYEKVSLSNDTYGSEDQRVKAQFIGEVCEWKPREEVSVLGCKTGTYALVAADHADRVLAMDADHLAVERLYQNLKKKEIKNVLPLVMNVCNLSPAQGWKGLERKRLEERSQPSLVLALALIHHVVISANVPMVQLIEWLASLEADLVIEFATREDPMVQRLLLNKEDNYCDYAQDYLEQTLKRFFSIESVKQLNGGQRLLFACRRLS